jgi:transposase
MGTRHDEIGETLAQKLLPPSPRLFSLGAVATPQALTLVASTVSPTAACPLCGVPSARAHSSYHRALTDLPCGGLPVRLHLHTRRFFCDRPDCPRVIFTERLPGVVLPHARRTLRLAEALRVITHALGGEAGARMTVCLGMPGSADTLLRQLSRREAPAPEIPRVLGVDDWALRKGHQYGTILVDLERGEVVDLLPDRTAETLAAWLKEHPGVEIVVRDRGGAYAQGAREGAPDAIQVADRWHLMKNLVEALEATLAREQPALQEAAQAAAPPAETAASSTGTPDPDAASTPDGRPAPPNRVARAQAQRREQKLAVYEEMLRLRDASCSQLAIARQVGQSLRTVHRYLHAPAFPERKLRTRPPGQLASYRPYLEQRWREGCHNVAQLWRELREQGFPGSYSSVHALLAEWQTQLPPEQRRGNDPRPLPGAVSAAPTPGAVVWWLLGRREKLSAEQAAYLERLTTLRPPIALAQELVQEFFSLTRRREAAALEPWQERVAASEIIELQRFSTGLRRDEAAVVAGLTLEWSTGPVEGQINRLKALKRAMYGRAGLPLLRARLLPLAAIA